MLFKVIIFFLCSDQQGKFTDEWAMAHKTMPDWDFVSAKSAAKIFNNYRFNSKKDLRKILISGFRSPKGLVFHYDHLKTATEYGHLNILGKNKGLAKCVTRSTLFTLVETEKNTVMFYKGKAFGSFVAMNNFW
jgi:hypothetical protein